MSPASTRLRHPLRLVAGLGALALVAACGGDGSQNFATCGNSRLETGEGCDDGNLDDGDACTSACQMARCGDGVVLLGIESCDGRDLNRGTCATLGLLGVPACDPRCAYDFSVCGPPIPTPTTTFTPAPPTPTRTVTPTPTPTRASQCGDGLLSIDETCTSCAADCTPLACDPTATTALVNVSLALPDGAQVSQVTVSLAYRTDTLSLPDSGLQARFQPATGIRVRPTDRGYLADVLVARTAGQLTSGAIFSATFDTCAGAPQPSDADFACAVAACGTASDCRCTADVP